MPEYHEYHFRLKHDRGTAKLRTVSTDMASAKKIIMAAERCPECAIIGARQGRLVYAY